ncbi:Uncharacterised protein [Mycobacteroides abscessus subsp. abscessus]|nr:Uncharacterised protein [Mycobacteroides abscessus subsp. abscessus]
MSTSSSVSSAKVLIGPTIPALLMTMSTLPQADSAVPTMARPPAPVATVFVSAMASPPRA